MFWPVVAMVAILLLAGGVVLYVAFPHRDRSVPGAPWVGEALKKGVAMVPPQRDGTKTDQVVSARPRTSHS